MEKSKVIWIPDQYEQALKDELKNIKNEKREKKIQKNFNQVKNIGKAFISGAIDTAIDPTALALGTVVGLSQGLKYSGNAKRGLVAGLATLAVVSVVGGVAAAGKGMKNQ